MKKSIVAIAAAILVHLLLITSGWCDWWLFKTSRSDEMSLSMSLDGTPYDELARKVTFYQETLRSGEVQLKGKATPGKYPIARIEVSLDGKGIWQSLPIEGKGSFRYLLRPAAGVTYRMYVRVTDTSGATNSVDSTLREISLSTQNVQQLLNKTLRELVQAYQDKNAAAFMANVSSDFVGDPTNLDRALRKEFSFFDNISVFFTINNMTASQNKIYVSLTYNRSLTSSRSGTVYRDSGITDYTFINTNGKLKIFSMKNPLIFGVSDAANLSAGNAANNPSSLVLVIDNKGGVTAQPYRNVVSGNTNSSATINFQFPKK